MEFDIEKKDDNDYVLEMVSKQGSLLDYASERLKDCLLYTSQYNK